MASRWPARPASALSLPFQFLPALMPLVGKLREAADGGGGGRDARRLALAARRAALLTERAR